MLADCKTEIYMFQRDRLVITSALSVSQILCTHTQRALAVHGLTAVKLRLMQNSHCCRAKLHIAKTLFFIIVTTLECRQQTQLWKPSFLQYASLLDNSADSAWNVIFAVVRQCSTSVFHDLRECKSNMFCLKH